MYKILDTKQTNILYLRRHGWLSPKYELTDNAESYGSLTYRSLFRRTAYVVTAESSWTFIFGGVFSRAILIIDQNAGVIGKTTRNLFSRRVLLTMETGFEAEFYRPVFFSLWTYIWESAGYGKIMRIKSSILNLKGTVNIEPGNTPAALMPLLIFLGEHLIILRRRRRAARH